jgi:hypothetical protein
MREYKEERMPQFQYLNSQQRIRDSVLSLAIMKTLSLLALAALSVPSVLALSGKATTTVCLRLFSLSECQTNQSVSATTMAKKAPVDAVPQAEAQNSAGR